MRLILLGFRRGLDFGGLTGRAAGLGREDFCREKPAGVTGFVGCRRWGRASRSVCPPWPEKGGLSGVQEWGRAYAGAFKRTNPDSMSASGCWRQSRASQWLNNPAIQPQVKRSVVPKATAARLESGSELDPPRSSPGIEIEVADLHLVRLEREFGCSVRKNETNRASFRSDRWWKS